ncbi:hypothetical protein KL928_000225 [Ogataea angusta]|uniref:Uncharacterized protein n=1 Tax=Pichia angusta TaxID=870730 RepID=A0AAN6I7R3_PICAN|nr:uncharacterized protein KL928_000225 [Ogataea angusta]KAG7821750.1 hypothetical protein KL928_000225 [Ogataea angusta]
MSDDGLLTPMLSKSHIEPTWKKTSLQSGLRELISSEGERSTNANSADIGDIEAYRGFSGVEEMILQRQNGHRREYFQSLPVPCVSQMEQCREKPSAHRHDSYDHVCCVEPDKMRVSCSNLLSALVPYHLGSPIVRKPISNAKYGAEKLLDTKDTNKRPLSVELVDLEILALAVLGDDPLALVVAIGETVPADEPQIPRERQFLEHVVFLLLRLPTQELFL